MPRCAAARFAPNEKGTDLVLFVQGPERPLDLDPPKTMWTPRSRRRQTAVQAHWIKLPFERHRAAVLEQEKLSKNILNAESVPVDAIVSLGVLKWPLWPRRYYWKVPSFQERYFRD